MTLIDLIPLWASICAASLALVVVFFMMTRGVVRTLIDPTVPVLFQVIFTLFILAFTGLIQVSDAIGMVLFTSILVVFPPRQVRGIQLFTEADWFSFSVFFCLFLVVMNIILVRQKGLLFMSDDIEVARQEFFQGWGLFKRINEVGQGLLVITAAFMWQRKQKKSAMLITFFACCIALTLGSRSGLLSCLLAYGAYLHFQKRKPSNTLLIITVVTLVCVTIGLFYLMYGNVFLASFGYRLLAECDGPVYFFKDKMQAITTVPLGYPFDILATSLRLRAEPAYVPLGQFILQQHFHFDTLQGPNPQLFVESHALFHSFGVLWYIICAAVFAYFRRVASNPYTFYLSAFFVGPLLADSQYAFSQVFTLMLIFAFFGAFLVGKWLLFMASRSKYRLEAEI